MAESDGNSVLSCCKSLWLRGEQPSESSGRGMAENLRTPNPTDGMMDERTQNLIVECKRQEESCLHTSTTLFEWLKSLRCWRVFFVVVPIILGAVATWPLLRQEADYKWLTGACALLAGLAPAVYKALNF